MAEEKLRVAAYCRVSTEKEDQLMSLRMQKDFFLAYAARHQLELVELYADEGISGTKLRNRGEFNRMMRDAETGRFQCVFVKDVSRLARNAATASGAFCAIMSTHMRAGPAREEMRGT